MRICVCERERSLWAHQRRLFSFDPLSDAICFTYAHKVADAPTKARTTTQILFLRHPFFLDLPGADAPALFPLPPLYLMGFVVFGIGSPPPLGEVGVIMVPFLATT